MNLQQNQNSKGATGQNNTLDRDALNPDKIIIYTKTGCPWCRDALALLKERSLPYKERDGIAQPKYFDEMVKLSGQTKAPTVIFPDGYILADTDAAAIAAYLDTTSYPPKSN